MLYRGCIVGFTRRDPCIVTSGSMPLTSILGSEPVPTLCTRLCPITSGSEEPADHLTRTQTHTGTASSKSPLIRSDITLSSSAQVRVLGPLP